ncbi:hypothetical protein NEMIN01_1922, partial [Nematocida minor]|uniref:uncharacterized protein n=1 Tax=Nematocida minor TaxID=1912983 RepID=UPI0022202EFE
ETETTLPLYIDVDEDAEEPAEYIVQSASHIGPIKHLLIIGHRQSIDIDYVVITDENVKKYQPEEDADGITLPLGQKVVNMHALESTILPDVNSEDKEIVQGPSIALETNSKIFLYDIMLELESPEKYTHTRRKQEQEMHGGKVNCNGVLPMSTCESTPNMAHTSDTVAEDSAIDEDVSHIDNTDTNVSINNSDKNSSNEEIAMPSKGIKYGDHKELEDGLDSLMAEMEREIPVETSVEQKNFNIGPEEKEKKKVEEEKPKKASPLSLSSLTGLVSSSPMSSLNSKTTGTPTVPLHKESPLEKPMRDMQLKHEKVDEQPKSDLLGDIKEEKKVQPRAIPEKKESPFDRIQEMIDGIDQSLKNPIVAVKEQIKEISEICRSCEEELETVYIPNSIPPESAKIKGLLMEIEEALIIMKDEKMRIVERIEDTDTAQERSSIILQSIHDRINTIENVLGKPPADFSREINYLNTRISRLFNISRHIKSKSKDQITLNSVNIFDKPLQLNEEPINKIEEGAMLPRSRNITLDLLNDCLVKILNKETREEPVEGSSILNHIFKTPSEQSFLKSIQAKKGTNKDNSRNESATEKTATPTELQPSKPNSASSTPKSTPISIGDLSQRSSTSSSLFSNSLPKKDIFGASSSLSALSKSATLLPGSAELQKSASSNKLGNPFSTDGKSPLGSSSSIFSKPLAQPSANLFSTTTPSIQKSTNAKIEEVNSTSNQSIHNTSPLDGNNSQFNSSNNMFSNRNNSLPNSNIFSSSNNGQLNSGNNSLPNNNIFSSGNNNNNLPNNSLFSGNNNSLPSSNIFSSGQREGQTSSSVFSSNSSSQMSGSIFSNNQGNQMNSNASSLFSNQQPNNSFNLLQRQNTSFTQGSKTLGLGSSSSADSSSFSSLFKKPQNNQNQQ